MTTPPDARGITVIKLGGSTLGEHDTSLRDIAAAQRAGGRMAVVHGGGAAVSAWLQRAGATARFVRGLRVTDAATLEVVVAVLAGVVNTHLVAELVALGAPAVGVSGADAGLLRARRLDPELGFVGAVERVEPRPLVDLLERGYVPVVAPLGVEEGETAQLLNINADTAAGELAAALGAARLVFLTDVDGVRDAGGRRLERLDAAAAAALIAAGTASGGMVPKLEAAVRAAGASCLTAIVDGRAAGALSRALAGEATGTAIVP